MKINFYNNTLLDVKEYQKLIKDIFKNMKQKEIMNIIFTTEEEIKSINKAYRDKDMVTDVISFANNDLNDLIEKIGIDVSNLELGDVFICLNRAFKQAEEYGHSVSREIGFLAVHGYLHLKGYDHMTKEDEEIMFKKQDDILKNAHLDRKEE